MRGVLLCSHLPLVFYRCVRLCSWLYDRSGAEGDGRDFDANGSPNSNVPTPLASPTDGGGGRGGGAVNPRGYGSEDGGGGVMQLPIGPPEMERVNSSSSLTGLVHPPISMLFVCAWIAPLFCVLCIERSCAWLCWAAGRAFRYRAHLRVLPTGLLGGALWRLHTCSLMFSPGLLCACLMCRFVGTCVT